MADARDTALALVEAFNTANWERFRSLSASDIVYEEAGTGRRIQGADDYLTLGQTWRQAFPDVIGEVDTVLSKGNTVAVAVTWSGTHTGPLATPAGEIPATGKPISVVSTLWCEVAEGKLQHVRNHLDVLGMMNQLGVLPA